MTDSLCPPRTQGVTVHLAPWNTHQRDLLQIRRKVFVQEQSVPEALEVDGQDADAVHFLARDHRQQGIGVARLLPSGQIGRVAVLQERRGFGVGQLLMQAAMEQAQQLGMCSIFLHAQVGTEQFYERLGFAISGAQFTEANIEHYPMHKELGIEFTPPVHDAPLQVVNPAQSRNDYLHPALWESPNTVSMLETEHELRDAIVHLCEHARREILILSQLLDHKLFNNPALLSCLSHFARLHHHSHVHILVHDTRPVVRDGHGMLDMVRRLPSSFSMRVVHPEMRDRDDSMILVDRTGMVGIPDYSIARGFQTLNDAALTRQYARLFHRLQDRSITDPNLRRLSI